METRGLEVDRLADRLRPSSVRIGLVPYLMAGHPNHEVSLDTARRLVDLDVAALELGIPCPDPRWDGPVIASAGNRALAGGASVGSALELAAQIVAGTHVPLVLMSYRDPLLEFGARRFAEEAAAAGVAGVIVPDLSPDGPEPLAAALRSAGVHTVRVVSPAMSPATVRRVCESSTGFVYCALAGRTGTRPGSAAPVLLDRVRPHTRLPLVAGFGISRPEHIAAMRPHADAVVVGSALVAELDAGRDITPLVRELLTACR